MNDHEQNGKINSQTFELILRQFTDIQRGQDELWRKMGSLERKIDGLAETAAFQKGKLYVIASIIAIAAGIFTDWIKQKLFN